MTNHCNLTSCQFNAEGICENEEAREDCVDMSRKVLCLNELVPEKHTKESLKELYDKCLDVTRNKYLVCKNDADKTPMWTCETVELGKKQLAKVIEFEPCVIIDLETMEEVYKKPAGLRF